MNTRVRHFLIDRARQRSNQTITYQNLSDECGLRLNMSDINDRNTLADILREVSTYEFENVRPLLSSLVVRAGDNYEGDGFYKLAERLGHGDWQKLKRDGIFEAEQINACIDFWKSDLNYTNFR